MPGPTKSVVDGAPPSTRKPKDATDLKSGYVVANRRTVWVEGKKLGPGSAVDLPADEREHLVKAGFIVAAADEPESGVGVRVGGLQIRGGRKPGGVVS